VETITFGGELKTGETIVVKGHRKSDRELREKNIR